MGNIVAEPTVSVDYEELEGSPKESYGSKGFQATRHLMCSWADRHTLARQLKGGRHYIGQDLVTLKPAYYPWYPVAVVSAVEIEGSGQPEGAVDESNYKRYEKAILTVTYSVQTYDEETIVEESVEPASEFLTIPANNLYWGYGDNKVALKEAEAPGLLIQMFDWNYTLKEVRSVPSWVKTLGGCVNNKTMRSDSLGMSFEPETLLAGKPKMERVVTTAGEKAWTISYSFTYRSIGWNKFPRVDAAGPNGIPFESITNGSTAIKIFKSMDFSSVLI
jgi:hypothetical protein